MLRFARDRYRPDRRLRDRHEEIASRYINMILNGEYSAADGLAAMKTELETALADGGYMQ